jgi:hypothetical protein
LSSTQSLSQQLKRLRKQLEQQEQEDPIVECFWDGELVEEEPGVTIVRTRWGRGTDPRKPGDALEMTVEYDEEEDKDD